MRCILGSIVSLAMIAAVASGAATTPPAAKKKAVAKSSAAKKAAPGKKPMTALQKNAAQKRLVASASSRNTSSRKKAPAKPAVTWRNRQLQPTQDRYREIQTALASKGYLTTEQATGTWNQNSADALKQFQSAQNLDASGKINSLSLIALGLGPKHDSTPVQAVQPAEPNR